MEIIKLTDENTKAIPLFIRDAEKCRKEIEHATGEKYGVALNLTCDK